MHINFFALLATIFSEVNAPPPPFIRLNQIPGVVTVGLFSQIKPHSCLVGYDEEVKEIFKKDVTKDL